ncbi:hypothetical protein [Ralstonia phage RP13]|nr:hypothetical protein [Ralstonia phage RP13]
MSKASDFTNKVKSVNESMKTQSINESVQLTALNKAIKSSHKVFEKAILDAAPSIEKNVSQYNWGMPVGWFNLESSNDADVKAYLEQSEENGNEDDEMKRYGEFVVEVLEKSGKYPQTLAEQKRINAEGL